MDRCRNCGSLLRFDLLSSEGHRIHRCSRGLTRIRRDVLDPKANPSSGEIVPCDRGYDVETGLQIESVKSLRGNKAVKYASLTDTEKRHNELLIRRRESRTLYAPDLSWFLATVKRTLGKIFSSGEKVYVCKNPLTGGFLALSESGNGAQFKKESAGKFLESVRSGKSVVVDSSGTADSLYRSYRKSQLATGNA